MPKDTDIIIPTWIEGNRRTARSKSKSLAKTVYLIKRISIGANCTMAVALSRQTIVVSQRGETQVIECIAYIIISVVLCFAFVVFLFACYTSFKDWIRADGWLKVKQRFCKHDFRKVNHKRTEKNGTHIVHRTKYRCKRCGKVEYR